MLLYRVSCVFLFVHLSFSVKECFAKEKANPASNTSAPTDEEHPLNHYRPDLVSFPSSPKNKQLSLDVNATKFDGRGFDWVTVSWKSVPSPREDDIIALYAYGEDDWLSKAPIKSTYASDAPTHLRSGSGSLPYESQKRDTICPEVRICRVRLFNHRTDVKFLFIREFRDRPSVLGESPVIKLRRGGYPLSVHLALTDKEKCVQHRVTPLTDCLVRCGCSGSRRRGRNRWCSGGPSQESSKRKRSQSGRRTRPRTCAVLRPRLCASCFCMKRLTSVLFV